MAKSRFFAEAIFGSLALAGFMVVPQRSRAGNAAAGSSAGRPDANAEGRSETPDTGWWHVVKRASQGFLDDRIMAEAAGVTFYAMLAIFPALAGLVSIYGLVADPSQLSAHMATLYTFLPEGGVEVIKAQVTSLTSSKPQTLGLGLVIGLLTSLWSANAGVKGFFDALNVVYHERERRSFLQLTLISLGFTLGIIALLLLALVAVVVVPIVLTYFGLGDQTAMLVNILRWPVMLVAVTLALALIYRFGPSRHTARWQWVSWGSGFAAFAWIIASLAFSYYVANFGSYNKTYGSLGAAMGFMTWIWVSSMVVLMGAELNAELEQQTDQDSTEGADKPRFTRGAFKADAKTA